MRTWVFLMQDTNKILGDSWLAKALYGLQKAQDQSVVDS